MILELKPAQQKVLDQAARSGMSPEEVLDQAFAVIQEQYRNEDWILANKEAIVAQIEKGFAQAERGELVDADQAVHILNERRSIPASNSPFPRQIIEKQVRKMSKIAHPGRYVDQKGSSTLPRFCLGNSGQNVVIY
jgi:predicted transcriptional regulator